MKKRHRKNDGHHFLAPPTGRKGSSFVMTIIVVMAILLVAMVLVLVVFSEKIFQFRKETESCLFKGGKCIDSSASCGEGDIIEADCPDGMICCVGA